MRCIKIIPVNAFEITFIDKPTQFINYKWTLNEQHLQTLVHAITMKLLKRLECNEKK